MTTQTAVNNVERYVMMLESGCPTRKAKERYEYAIGHLKMNANYMQYGHYEGWSHEEEKQKEIEREKGANLTPMTEVMKAARKGIKSGRSMFYLGGRK